jgi:uncharacterized protein (TIGR02145 family)
MLFAAAFFLTGKTEAQNHIKVTPINITYSNAMPVVKFRVEWKAIPNDNYTHNTKVWVWIDYHKVENHRLSGVWTRATISGLSAGTVAPGNKGFWLQGNTGAYSQEVSVTLSGMPPKFSWCAYVSDALPVAKFTAADSIRFYGSKPFTVTYSDKSIAKDLPEKPYTPPAGKEITAFTDATGCPGVVQYSMTAPSLNGGGSYCAASAKLTAKSKAGIQYQLLKEGVKVGAVQAGTGGVLTWTVHAAGSYSLSATHTATASTATGNQQKITLNQAPTAPDSVETNVATICHTIATSVTLTAKGGNKGSGAVYEWGTGATPGSNLLNPATTTANTCVVKPDKATTYWVRLVGNTACKNATPAVTVSIGTYTAFTAGYIVSDSTTTTVGVKPGVTVKSDTVASGGGMAISYQWRRSGTSSATLTGDTATYVIDSNKLNYDTSGTYYFMRYAKNDVCDTVWVASGGTYTLIVEVPNADQGLCGFRKPAVVGTFAKFPSSYSASTYVSLTDERDGKSYAVVKIGNRWIMGQNLNYQKDLVLNSRSSSFTSNGSFWCPSVDKTDLTSSFGCNVFGALYDWKTAMKVDGKWKDDSRNDLNWPGDMCNGGNCGLGANGHGICPPNWHIPTDDEWGKLLNEMETGNKNHNTGSTGYLGTDAGVRGKSACLCPGDYSLCVSDLHNLWQYSSDVNTGTDNYNFRVLPAGFRYYTGKSFLLRGKEAFFWSSTAVNNADAVWFRQYSYNTTTVHRANTYRASGFSVRCMRD